MSRIRQYLFDQTGAAAVEMALFAVILAPMVANAADIGMYLYQRQQVENAAQAGAQAAYATCQSAPPTGQTLLQACPSFSATGAVAKAVQGSALGSLVSWSNTAGVQSSTNGVGSEAGPFCPTATNTLVGQTSNCSATSAPPGYYVKITVSYQFRGLFGGATIASLLPQSISRSSWVRLT